MQDASRTDLVEVFDSAAGIYDSGPVQFFRPIGRRLVELAAPRAGERALDVGCGRGAVLYPLADAVGSTGSAVGIDVTEGMVAETSAEVAESGRGNVEVRRMDGAAPEFDSGEFDLITGSMSIIMIPDLPEVFGNYAELLRPGGRLAFTSPAIDSADPHWNIGPIDFDEMVRAALASAGGDGAAIQSFVETLPTLADDVLSGDLRAAGFTDTTTVQEALTVTAATPDELVDWSWTHGMRMLWERMSEQAQAEQRARIVERCAEFTREDGTVAFDTPIRYIIAHTS